jgi:acetylornithine/succinyldiaminopimelate/putrescine aminotransferase
MDGKSIFDWAIGIGGAAVGWMLKVIWEAIKEVKAEVRDLENQMHQDYVRRDDFRQAIAEIKADMKEGFREVKDMVGLVCKKMEDKEDKQ